jgi:hypothetical protein
MNTKLSQIFKNIEEIEAPARLDNLIMQKINILEKAQERRKLIFSYFSMGTSVAAFLYAGLVFGREILGSDFWNTASLISTDFFTIIQHWQEFINSLLETFPVVNIIALLIPVLALFLSLNYFFSIHKNTYRHKYI